MFLGRVPIVKDTTDSSSTSVGNGNINLNEQASKIVIRYKEMLRK